MFRKDSLVCFLDPHKPFFNLTLFSLLKCLDKVVLDHLIYYPLQSPTAIQSMTNHLSIHAYQFVPFRSPGKELNFMNVRCEKFAESK